MRKLISLIVGASLALAIVTPAVAGTARHTFHCEEHYVSSVNGTMWVSGGVLHHRGGVWTYRVTGDAWCAGTYVITLNYNLEMATSTGTLWGTATTALDAFDGGFALSWHGHWTASPLPPDAQDVWLGDYVGHGYGDLAGWQSRGELLEKSHVLVLEDGLAFYPGD